MSRMPIRLRSRLLWPKEDASPRPHAVLGRISPGYPAETGRLHTRYSPVRRSPAEQSKLRSPMPLDLHVLGLSLAFILSQDQTLRCIFFILYYTFEALPDRIDFFLSSFPVLHLLLQFPQ